MDKELQFARILEQVKRTGRKQGGFIPKSQVEEAFLDLHLTQEQLQLVYDYLAKNHVGIDTPAGGEDPSDENLSDQEKGYLQNYYNDLEALPFYNDGEKRAYTISAMAGETEAQKKIIEIYLKDVAQIAKLYTGQGVFVEDLIGEGNLALAFGSGMLGSLEDPDEAEGMLMKLVMDAMEERIKSDADSAKIDRRALDRVNRINDKARELSEAYGRDVTVEELAAEAGLKEQTIRDAMRISGYKIENLS